MDVIVSSVDDTLNEGKEAYKLHARVSQSITLWHRILAYATLKSNFIFFRYSPQFSDCVFLANFKMVACCCWALLPSNNWDTESQALIEVWDPRHLFIVRNVSFLIIFQYILKLQKANDSITWHKQSASNRNSSLPPPNILIESLIVDLALSGRSFVGTLEFDAQRS